MQHQRPLRVLHVFDAACNLVDANAGVVSVVTPPVGNGPFNLVVPQICFSEIVAADSPVVVHQNTLTIGDLNINTASATIWNPCPPWNVLRQNDVLFFHYLPLLRAALQATSPVDSFAALVVDFPPPILTITGEMLRTAKSAAGKLIQGLLRDERHLCLEGVNDLAGLGGGLTPSGDDWIMGCVLATRIVCHPNTEPLIRATVAAAAKRTTSLSAAWLQAAARGECSASWHSLFAAIHLQDEAAVWKTAAAIILQGHTSGSDALAGFVATLAAMVS